MDQSEHNKNENLKQLKSSLFELLRADCQPEAMKAISDVFLQSAEMDSDVGNDDSYAAKSKIARIISLL